MTEPLIDEKIKSYLIACLVTGIDVISDQSELMTGIVDHLNSTERIYWAQGDEDGIIVHDKQDVPILYLMYNGKRLTFRVFAQDEFLENNPNKDVGLVALNVIGYLQNNALEFEPSILGSEAHVVANLSNTGQDNTSSEDWAL